MVQITNSINIANDKLKYRQAFCHGNKILAKPSYDTVCFTAKSKDVKQVSKPEAKSLSTIPENFQVNLPISIKMEDLKSLLADNLNGKELNMDGRTITITNTDLYNEQGNVVLQTNFKTPGPGGLFDLKGQAFLIGKPIYDKTTQSIKLDPLSFEIKTDSTLLKIAKIFMGNKFANDIKSKLQFPVADIMLESKNKLQKSLNVNSDDDVSMKSTVKDISINGISVTDDTIKLHVFINGVMSFVSNLEDINKSLEQLIKTQLSSSVGSK